MATEQPEWELVANLGDVNPEYGGYFVYRDSTGVYTEEAEYVDASDNPDDTRIYRFTLDKCTFIDGVLSDNPYHPEMPAWFADSLAGIAACCDTTPEALRDMLCSNDPCQRAEAYRNIGSYHGFENLDSYPLELSDEQVIARYEKDRKPRAR
jgi:hypothetical protein